MRSEGVRAIEYAHLTRCAYNRMKKGEGRQMVLGSDPPSWTIGCYRNLHFFFYLALGCFNCQTFRCFTDHNTPLTSDKTSSSQYGFFSNPEALKVFSLSRCVSCVACNETKVRQLKLHVLYNSFVHRTNVIGWENKTSAISSDVFRKVRVQGVSYLIRATTIIHKTMRSSFFPRASVWWTNECAI